jgi:hypothetical protein
LKKFLLLVFVLLSVKFARAQSGYNYPEFAVGAGASYVRALADLRQQKNNMAFHVDFTYNYSPYIPITAEFQFGKLSGGDRLTDKDTREFENSYKALILHGDFEMGEAIDYSNSTVLNVLKGFYIGSGVGLISNNMTKIYRYSAIDPTYMFPGTNSSINLLIPIRFGYEIKFFNDYDEPSFSVNLGYTHNVTIGEGLDGYADPQIIFKNNAPDQYSQIVIGFKYHFGDITAYTKNIRGNRY